MTIRERAAIAWRVAVIPASTYLAGMVPYTYSKGPHWAVELIALCGLFGGPILGLLWARRVIAAASKTSYLALAPIYVVLLVWAYWASFRVRIEVGDAVRDQGLSREMARTLAIVADPIAFGIVIVACTFATASWKSRPDDLRTLAIIIACVLGFLVLVPMAFI